MAKRVTGIGGIFFKAEDAPSLLAWYEKHLGIKAEPWGGTAFTWQYADGSGRTGQTVWAIFPRDTGNFKNSRANHMLNYRVENLDALLEQLAGEGVEIDPKRENSDFGRFAWITDPEGNRIELWEPPAGE
ncbi:MAG TPA: VOC family protein [Terriglobia bacterium]|nr:VOC family protein [Terriglobia bacterium]